MPDNSTDPQRSDPVWTAIRAEAWSETERDPYLSLFLTKTILKSKRLENALGLILSSKLTTDCVNPALLQSRIDEAFSPGTGIGEAVRADLNAVRDRDPASRGF